MRTAALAFVFLLLGATQARAEEVTGKVVDTAGKPVVGVRTASHSFQNWLEFDKLVLGCNYGRHYGTGKDGIKTTITPASKEATNHPILRGIDLAGSTWESTASLYRVTPLLVVHPAEVVRNLGIARRTFRRTLQDGFRFAISLQQIQRLGLDLQRGDVIGITGGDAIERGNGFRWML